MKRVCPSARASCGTRAGARTPVHDRGVVNQQPTVMHLCRYCHKSLRTRQGLRAHMSLRPACRLAHQQSLASQPVRTYDPRGPEALFRVRPIRGVPTDKTDTLRGRQAQRHMSEKTQQHFQDLAESRARREKIAEARKRKALTQDDNADDAPSRRRARIHRPHSDDDLYEPHPDDMAVRSRSTVVRMHAEEGPQEARFRELEEELNADSQAEEEDDDILLSATTVHTHGATIDMDDTFSSGLVAASEKSQGSGHRRTERAQGPLQPWSVPPRPAGVRDPSTLIHTPSSSHVTSTDLADRDCSSSIHPGSSPSPSTQGQSDTGRRSKVKMTDFGLEYHSIIHLACRYYRVILCTTDPFPLEHDRVRLLREAWKLACSEHDMQVGASGDVFNMIKQRGSQVRGELKRNARPVTTAHYKFDAREEVVKGPILNNEILYKDHEARTGLFENPCAARILRTQWFADAHDEGVSFHVYFNPIPLPTLALVFTAIENCVEEWKDGRFHSIDFTEKLYRKKYERHLSNLENWSHHPQGKHILARLQQRLHDSARAFSGAGPLQNPLPTMRKLTHDDFDAALTAITIAQSMVTPGSMGSAH
ncbi:hypothetical protein JB92DRAFT_3138632 [Gautieria morchelliformis]|nr:hypothetical protein JB92DRAFT_3138632 [Gautieria morchelliformis]